MQKQSQPHKASAKFKFVDLSSEGESDYESEKENADARSHITNKTYSIQTYKPCTLEPLHQNGANRSSSIINQGKSTAALKELQFSTLSLEDKSMAQIDSQARYGVGERDFLLKQNQQLKALNRQLQQQLNYMIGSTTAFQQKLCEYEQQFSSYQQQISNLKGKISSIELAHSKTVKEYQNKLINLQLPGNPLWTQQTDKIYSKLSQNINSIVSKYLNELAQERMNNKVEEIITKFINELTSIKIGSNPPTISDSSNYASTTNKFKSKPVNKSYRSQKMSELGFNQSHLSSIVSQDYRLLEKSIQKLKHMQKQIESSSGSYLKRKAEEDSSFLNKSVGLDQSSICDLGRSKSRRKRIFQ